MWVVYAFVSAFFAGITAILAKIGIKDVDSYLATALRTIVVLIFAWAMVFIVGSQDTIQDVNGWSLLFLILSGCTTGASWLYYFKALQVGDVNKVVPIDKSSTALTIVLAIIFLGEPFNLLKLICVLAIAGGTYLMLETKNDFPMHESKDRSWLVYALLSAFFASLTAILGKIGIENIESNLGTAIRTVVVLVMAWLIVFMQGSQKGIADISRKSWCFLILSGIATGMSWLFFYRALQEGPASVVVPIDKLSILVSVCFGYLAFGEKLSAKSAAGLALIVIGTLGFLL